MSYLQRNKFRKSSKKSLILGFLFLAGALILTFFGTNVLSLVSPLWQAENAFTRSTANTFQAFKGNLDLAQENSRLRERISSYEAELSTLNYYKDRERELLELMGRSVDPQGVLASVLAGPPRTPYDTVVIDAGASEGVREGMKVAMIEGSYLGQIFEVADHTSKVRLYTSNGDKTPAILERGSLPVILVGAGGGNFRLILPRDAWVEVGDRILSADISGRLIGIVEDVSLKPTDPYKEVLSSSPVNIFGMRYVKVMP